MRTVTAHRSRRRGQRAQSLVEFAALAPFLLLLLVGGAQVAVLVFSQIATSSAARESARAAADNPYNSSLFAAPKSHTCATTDTALYFCQAAYRSTSTTFGLIDSTKFAVAVSSTLYVAPGASGADTTVCGGKTGTANDGQVSSTVSFQAPIFVPFIDRFFSDPGKSYRTVSATVSQRVAPCLVNDGN